MKSSSFGLAAMFAASLASSAYAQTSWVEIGDQVAVAPFDATVDQIDDWDVLAADGTKIGEVEEVLGTAADQPTALVVDFEGNGGHQDRDVIIPIDQFSLADSKLTLNADAAAIADMEVWND